VLLRTGRVRHLAAGEDEFPRDLASSVSNVVECLRHGQVSVGGRAVAPRGA
jgi:hypothetical protein